MLTQQHWNPHESYPNKRKTMTNTWCQFWFKKLISFIKTKKKCVTLRVCALDGMGHVISSTFPQDIHIHSFLIFPFRLKWSFNGVRVQHPLTNTIFNGNWCPPAPRIVNQKWNNELLCTFNTIRFTDEASRIRRVIYMIIFHCTAAHA